MTTAETGTITWFEIAKGELPPIDTDNMNAGAKELGISVNVLIWREGCSIKEGLYHYKPKEWRFHGRWQPTHWAFINYPNI